MGDTIKRLRARCPGPGGEYQVSGDDLDALLRLGEASERLDDAMGMLQASLTMEAEAREQVALAELAYDGAARVLRGR